MSRRLGTKQAFEHTIEDFTDDMALLEGLKLDGVETREQLEGVLRGMITGYLDDRHRAGIKAAQEAEAATLRDEIATHQAALAEKHERLAELENRWEQSEEGLQATG